MPALATHKCRVSVESRDLPTIQVAHEVHGTLEYRDLAEM